MKPRSLMCLFLITAIPLLSSCGGDPGARERNDREALPKPSKPKDAPPEPVDVPSTPATPSPTMPPPETPATPPSEPPLVPPTEPTAPPTTPSGGGSPESGAPTGDTSAGSADAKAGEPLPDTSPAEETPPPVDTEDAGIVTRVKGSLGKDPDTEVRGIAVDSSKGVVTLSGSVSTPEQRDRAQSAAEAEDGVVRVVNKIVVKPTP